MKHSNKKILVILAACILALFVATNSIQVDEEPAEAKGGDIYLKHLKQIQKNQALILERLRIIEARQIYAFIQWGWLSVPYRIELKVKKAAKLGEQYAKQR